MERRMVSIRRPYKDPIILHQRDSIHPIIHLNDHQRHWLHILQHLLASVSINILAITIILWVDHDR